MTEEFPDWFEGEKYKNAAETTIYIEVKVKLSAVEISLYRRLQESVKNLFVAQEDETKITESEIEQIKRWFYKNNKDAYMVLID